MAFVPQQLPDDEKNQLGRTGQTTPQPVPPPQAGGSSGSGTNAAPGQASSTQFGSNAAKLSDYLSANKDQVQNFGNQVAGNLNQNFTNTQNAIDQGFGNFNSQVNQGYTQANPDLVSKAAANPTDFAKDPNNVSSFKSLYNDSYKGPSDFESTPIYQDLNNQVNKAVENAGLVGSQSGLQSYLNNNFGTANNTPGMQTLDTALLQRSPEARSAIQTAAAPYSGLNTYLGNTATAGDQNVASAKKNASDISQAAQNQFTGQGGVIPTAQADLQSRLGAARSTANTQAQADKSLLSGTLPQQLTPQQLKDLGMSWNDYVKFYNNNNYLQQLSLPLGINTGTPWSPYQGGFTPASYLTTQDPNAAITASNFASPEDYAKFAALQQLTGQDLSGTLDQANVGQAGTAPTDLSQFNSQALPDVQNLVSQYSRSLANYLQPNQFSQRLDPNSTDDQVMNWLQQNKYISNPYGNPIAGPGTTSGVF